jgi:hypothetical protein
MHDNRRHCQQIAVHRLVVASGHHRVVRSLSIHQVNDARENKESERWVPPKGEEQREGEELVA